MKRALSFGLGAALACGTLSACSESGPSGPSNPALERIAQKVPLNLGGLTVHQTISFQTTTGERVAAFNLTDKPVDTKLFQGVINYYAQEGQQRGNVRTLRIHPRANGNWEAVTSVESAHPPTQHDFVFLPKGAPAPRGMEQTNGAITYEENDGQISILQSDTQKYGPSSVPGWMIEGCQSFIQMDGVLGDTINADPMLAGQLAQETECNSEAAAIYAATLGDSYQDYQQQMADASDDWGHVSYTDVKYPLTPFTIPNSEYDKMVALKPAP